MPLSESTIAIAGPAASAASTASLASGCALQEAAEAVVGTGVEAVVDVADHRANRVAEDDRVGDLHHRRLQVHGEEHALRLGVGDLLGEERVERRAAHDGGVEHLAGEHRRCAP